MDKSEFKELNEFSTFAQEEDKAILTQFDGEDLVQSLGTLTGESISKDIKHAVPNWVSDKWNRKFGKKMKAAGDKEAKEEAKEEKKEELAQK